MLIFTINYLTKFKTKISHYSTCFWWEAMDSLRFASLHFHGGVLKTCHRQLFQVHPFESAQNKKTSPQTCCFWWEAMDSNHRPSAYQADALTS